MKTYVLDSLAYSDVSAFYDDVSTTFGFFAGFGRNLDALFDCLDDASEFSDGSLSRFEKPCEVVWKESSACRLPQEFKDSVFEIFSEVDGIDFRVE